MLLKFFRKRKNMKRIMWALAILIIPAFVIWGAGSSGKKRGEGPDYAGKIFNKKVSFEEYRDMWYVTRDNLSRSFGNNVPAEFIDQMTWNRILLLEEAKRQKIVVEDSEVIENIFSFPAFQRDGRFDKKLYKSMLGDAVKNFEARLRDDMLISKLRDTITSRISVTDDEVKLAYKKKFEKIKASYISIPFIDFEEDIRYQEHDLIEFYGRDKEAFGKPEHINVKYIEVLFSDFDKDVFMEEEAVKRYFEEHISDFKKPDSDEPPVLDDEIKKEVSNKLSMERKKSLAEELSYKILDGAADKKDMDEVASSFELETKETGFFNMQEEIPGIGWSYEFTKKGFELNPGEISKALIKTASGLYIIQLKERRGPYLPEFEEIRDSVMERYKKHESIKIAEKEAKKLYLKINNKMSSGSKFEDIVKEAGLESKQTDFVTRDGYIPTLGPARDFIDACVSLKTGEITGSVKMPESWTILKLDGYQDIDEVEFVKQKSDFKEQLLSRKQQDGFNKWFKDLERESDFVSYTAE